MEKEDSYQYLDVLRDGPLEITGGGGGGSTITQMT